MDEFGWLIATMHGLLGHQKAALVLGVPPGDQGDCLICAYEEDPTSERKQAVVTALSS